MPVRTQASTGLRESLAQFRRLGKALDTGQGSRVRILVLGV